MAGPKKKIRAGSISCALWENEATINGKPMKLLRATVERRYKDSNGDWQSSGSFGRNEIPLVIYSLTKAFEIMVGEHDGRSDAEVAEEEVVE